MFLLWGDSMKFGRGKVRKKLELTHGEILGQVRDYLRLKGFFVIPILQGLGCHPGISDLVAVGREHSQAPLSLTLWIEIKTLKGNLSDKQMQFSRDIHEHGGLYLTIHSLEEIQEWVK